MTPDDNLVAQRINKKKKFFFDHTKQPSTLDLCVNVLVFQENLFGVLDRCSILTTSIM